MATLEAARAQILPASEAPQLRVLTCGSVDDGKSTLLGRLLFDTHAVLEDQLAALDAESRRWGTQGAGRDYALLLDGLSAEREQGITIDVAYRYFATDRRSFILIDTPGHEQYTRNMATGASQADLAIILIDARKGVLPQTRRHAFIAATLGIRHAVLAVNKMDLAGFAEARFREIADAFASAVGRAGLRLRGADPDQRPRRRQRGAALAAHGVAPRADPARTSRNHRRQPGRRRRAVPPAGPARPAPGRRFPRLCRNRRRRRGPSGGPHRRAAQRPRRRHRPHRHRRRRPHRSCVRRGRHPDARSRDRHRPWRRDRRARRRACADASIWPRRCSGWPTSRCSPAATTRCISARRRPMHGSSASDTPSMSRPTRPVPPPGSR